MIQKQAIFFLFTRRSPAVARVMSFAYNGANVREFRSLHVLSEF